MPVSRGHHQASAIGIVALFLVALLAGCVMPQAQTPPLPPAPTTQPNSTGSQAALAVTATGTPVVPNTTATTATPDLGFETKGALNKIYYYIVDGMPGYIPFQVFTGVNDYISGFGDIYTGDDYKAVIGNPVQQKYTEPMVENIRRAAKNPDDDARIAISLVQHIKYDANAINEIQVNTSKTGQLYIGRYPYTILDENWGGICGEKSFLLALLLKELGYGVALYEFDDIHHMALGIKAPSQYQYEGTGYAIIESTAPEIPTFDQFGFVGTNVTLASTSPTRITVISDGKSFETIGTEYSDAQLEGSIYEELGKVEAAAETLNAAAQQLNQLKAIAVSWATQAQNDYSQGNFASYQNDLQQYNQAKAAYDAYYNQIYNPAYTTWNSLQNDYQSNYAPKQKMLEDKYGMTTGIGVGL